MSQTNSGKRFYLFLALALAIPLLFFVLLETGLRRANYGDTQPLFIPPHSNIANDDYLTINPFIVNRYFHRPGFKPIPPHDLFRKQKPVNGYRIFVLGESTTAGWPYPENVMFSRILEQRLADAFPEKYIEVINTGITAVNSYTLLDFIDEILEHKPDTILIYAGHNEFYGALGAASAESIGQSRWIIQAYLSLLKFRTVQFMRNGINDGVHLPADAAYAQAQRLEKEQKFDLAKKSYVQAMDLDGMRFRAPEEFNAVIHKVAAEFNTPVVPMKSYFEKASPHGIIGASLMLEHLHPNADGYFLMSEAFFDTMQQHRFISERWDENKMLPAASYRLSWPVTGFDRALGEIRITNLTDHWPFLPKPPRERTIANFQPRNKAEDLAFKHFNGELSYMDGHLEMASHHEAEGRHDLALREYYALINAAPYNIESYFPAIRARKETLTEFETAHRYIGQLEKFNNADPNRMAALKELLDQQEKWTN